MPDPYSNILITQDRTFDKKAFLYYVDEILRGFLYAGPTFFTTQYIVEGFQVSEHTAEFSPSLIAGIVTGTSIAFSMAIYYSNKKLLKSAQEVWLTTWSNFTFLLWAENFVLGQILKWSNLNEVIPGASGDVVFVSLFFTGMFFSLNNDAVKEFIADFFPQLIQRNISQPRRIAQQTYNFLAKIFEGVGLGDAIGEFVKLLFAKAPDGIKWPFMVSYGSYKGFKEYAPNAFRKVINYSRSLWQRLWYGNYQEIESPVEEEIPAPSTVLEPQLSFLNHEDRLGAALFGSALIDRFIKFKNPQNALPIILALLGKALLTPLAENRATYAALNQQLKTGEKEKPPESEPEEIKSESESESESEDKPEITTTTLTMSETEEITPETRRKLKEEVSEESSEEETEKKFTEFTT